MESSVSSETSIVTWLHGATFQNTLMLHRITNLTLFLIWGSFNIFANFEFAIFKVNIFGRGYEAPSIDRAVAGEGGTGRQDWNKTLFDYVSSNLDGLQMSLSGVAQISLSADLNAPTPTPSRPQLFIEAGP
jgi:hypothetical protein